MQSSIPPPCKQQEPSDRSRSSLALPSPSPLQRVSTAATWPCELPSEFEGLVPIRTLDRTPYGRTKLALDSSKSLVSVRLHRKEADEKDAAGGAVLRQIQSENHMLKLLFQGGGHSGLVRCIQDCDGEAYYWSIREFSGTTLLDLVVRDGPVPNNTAKALFSQLVGAVSHMHSHGYCHLNINLENVFVFGEDTSEEKKDSAGNHQIKLGGFSCTVELPSNNQSIEGITDKKPGKLEYMAPEIFAGESFNGKQADTYSLGVLLFEMLTGHPAYEQPSSGDTRFRLLYEGKLSMLLSAWGHSTRVDARAVGLLSSLVCKPDRRLTLEEVLKHPWFTEEN